MTAFQGDAVTVAHCLLGKSLVRVIDGERLEGTIVEVEAYLGLEDAAAHTFNGRRTPRNESMYLPGGHAYVYMIYGMHHCLNVVCGEAGDGVAVLIRALQPTSGMKTMLRNRIAGRQLRRRLSEKDLCSGPGKVAQAMAIDRELDGECLISSDRLWVEGENEPAVATSSVVSGPRIGVAYAGEWAARPLRFFLDGNLFVSC